MLSTSLLRRRRLLLTITNSSSLHHHLLLSSSFSSLPNPPAPNPKTTPTVTHDSVLYVLKKLDRHPLKSFTLFNHLSSVYPSFKPNSIIYTLLLRSLARKDSIDHFWDVARRMERDGYTIDAAAYFSILVSLKKQRLVDDATHLTQFVSRAKEKKGGGGEIGNKVSSVVEALCDVEDWGEEIEKRLDEIGLDLSESTVSEVLRELKHRPSKALGFFQWAGKDPDSDYKHGPYAYNSMLRVLCRKESVEDFWVLVDVMKREGHQIDIDSYIKILRQFLDNKMLNAAVDLYEVMMDSPYKPAIHDCGLLLRQIALSDPPDHDLVNRVVNKYEANGNSMSKVVYDGILRSLTRGGKFDEASELVEKMKVAGFEPDNITYSQLVFGLCKAKRFDDARKLLEDMEECGCSPDVKTWTILIQGHCLAGEIDAALACLTNMVAKNYSPDGELLDVLVKGLCNVSRTSNAYTLFTEMVGKGNVKPRQATFKFLIKELLSGRRLEEALDLLVMMKKHQLPPFADPFSPYISKYGTVEDGRDFLKALNAKDSPSLSAYLFLFTSFFNEGRYSEAQDLLFRCPHHIRKHSDISKLFGSMQSGTAT